MCFSGDTLKERAAYIQLRLNCHQVRKAGFRNAPDTRRGRRVVSPAPLSARADQPAVANLFF